MFAAIIFFLSAVKSIHIVPLFLERALGWREEEERTNRIRLGMTKRENTCDCVVWLGGRSRVEGGGSAFCTGCVARPLPPLSSSQPRWFWPPRTPTYMCVQMQIQKCTLHVHVSPKCM